MRTRVHSLQSSMQSTHGVGDGRLVQLRRLPLQRLAQVRLVFQRVHAATRTPLGADECFERSAGVMNVIFGGKKKAVLVRKP